MAQEQRRVRGPQDHREKGEGDGGGSVQGCLLTEAADMWEPAETKSKEVATETWRLTQSSEQRGKMKEPTWTCCANS